MPARASDELYVRLPPEEVREHVHLWLLAPERELPEVVITTRHGRTLVEPDALARRLGGRAQVVLVELVEAKLGDDDRSDHARAVVERHREERLVDRLRPRNRLCELAFRRIARKNGVAAFNDITRHAIADRDLEHVHRLAGRR